jgi:NitT/TauT family transport system substrate-binding protein
MTEIRIRVLRHSAFYAPLLVTISGGYLEQEGLKAVYDVASDTRPLPEGLISGEVHVAQSAVATSFAPLERGESLEVVHFAQINERDGFFVTARQKPADFQWQDLVGQPVLVDHFFQPLAMFKYALSQKGIGLDELKVIDAGDVAAIDRAFRDGQGAYVHQQGPAAQQLEHDGIGTVVASVGEVIGPVAFSSLCATPAWLKTPMALAFMRAYRQARKAVMETPAAELAPLLTDFFPDIDPAVLQRTVAAYQHLGCWSEAPRISAEAYEKTLDVFAFSDAITRRHSYDEVCCPPPDEI